MPIRSTSTQHLLLTAEKKFWRCVQSGEPPLLFAIETPRPRLAAVKVVDMTASNLWAACAATYLRTREAHAENSLQEPEPGTSTPSLRTLAALRPIRRPT
ncbi:hypothetical protein GA0061098_1009123 [Bradyrhizobium shewense]|uniref:Uncharacterized protein n=1 Tax=Bradyrhizobium shewense TaxID=1761772 RepID=A0A1C3WR23_9BRAD|nr:hypothetical protein GA0061098_1009123 [Bradyrhizobium shewense]